MQVGTPIGVVLKEKSFSEPRLVIFSANTFIIVVEGEVAMRMAGPTSVAIGLLVLLAFYYVFHVAYPKSCLAQGQLMFAAELLIELEDNQGKKTAKYSTLIDKLLS
jgi:hypothetical protein